MNFLAHSFLSFSDEQIVGNMIADYVHNRDVQHLPMKIQEGIRLHRAIDTFTDSHPVTHDAKKVFQPLVRLYAGAFTDVTMDYFLANDTTIYSEAQWEKHSQHVYQSLEKFSSFLPERFKAFLPKMESDDWLFNYRNDRGIKYSMQNVLNKAKYLDKNLPVFKAFLEQKRFLSECYGRFFPELRKYATEVAENFNKGKS